MNACWKVAQAHVAVVLASAMSLHGQRGANKRCPIALWRRKVLAVRNIRMRDELINIRRWDDLMPNNSNLDHLATATDHSLGSTGPVRDGNQESRTAPSGYRAIHVFAKTLDAVAREQEQSIGLAPSSYMNAGGAHLGTNLAKIAERAPSLRWHVRSYERSPHPMLLLCTTTAEPSKTYAPSQVALDR